MAKPKGYDIPNPEATPPESKKEQQAREKREKKFLKAAFHYTPDQLQARHEKQPRHAEYQDTRSKGDRTQQKRAAIEDRE